MYVSNNFFGLTEEFRFFQIQLVSITSKLKNYFNNKIDGKKKRRKIKLYEKNTLDVSPRVYRKAKYDNRLYNNFR